MDIPNRESITSIREAHLQISHSLLLNVYGRLPVFLRFLFLFKFLGVEKGSTSQERREPCI